MNKKVLTVIGVVFIMAFTLGYRYTKQMEWMVKVVEARG